MRKYVLLAPFAMLCATVSTAGASDLADAPAAPVAPPYAAEAAPPYAVGVAPPYAVAPPVAVVTPVYPYRYGFYPRYYAPYAHYPYGHRYAFGGYARGHRHW